MVTILTGDCQTILPTLSDRSVHCCVTSPPYWGLRDYGMPEQLGMEPTPEEYVAHMVGVFREVRRILRDDGILWLNLGDSYAARGGDHALYNSNQPNTGAMRCHATGSGNKGTRHAPGGLKPKDLVGIPWRVAFALQADGWYLRQDIIWHKLNPMPESVTDRCTKAHEYIFLLAKSPRYYYDAEAVAESVAPSSIERLSQPNLEAQAGSSRVPGKTNGNMKAVGRGGRNAFRGQGHFRDGENGPANRDGRDMRDVGAGEDKRNRRSVWTVATKPYSEAHFAVYPPELITPCILAGCPMGGTVLDPFGGSGTTAQVAEANGRNSIIIELNPAYVKLAERRTEQAGLFCNSLDSVEVQP